jgi:soluble lytic murein transglycosylase
MPSKAIQFLLFYLLAGLPQALFAQDRDQRDSFARAYASYTAGNLSQAKELFSKSLDPKDPLADYSLHYLAQIAFNEKNWDATRRLLSQLRQQFPQSIWFHPATLQRIKVDRAEKQYPQAISALRALRIAKGVRNEIIEESFLLEAQTHEVQGDPRRAYSLYDELRNTFPLSRFTPTARKAQAQLREKFPDLFEFNTLPSLADEADRLTREREYGPAEILYKKLVNNATDADLRLRFLAKLSALYLTVRNRNESIPLLEQIAREYPDSGEAAKALYQIGQILWNRNDNAQALNYFKLVLERYPTSPFIDRAQYAAGDIHESFGRKEEAIQLYTNLPKQFPASQVRDDAAWRLAWLYYRAGDFTSALVTFKSLAGQSKDGLYRTAAIYWQARAAEKLGDQETAKQLYRQMTASGDESYYQALSLRGLKRLGIAVEETQPIRSATVTEPDPPMSAESAFHLARARELAALALHPMAVVELDEVNRRARTQTRLRPLLMREYFQSHAYRRSLALADQLPGSQKDRNQYRYPLAHWDLIQQKALGNDVDPYLVLALIRQESLFDARARSPAFALGLMQLIPATAARVAKQIGLDPPSNDKLFEPELNLTLGIQYLKDLLRRYANNWFKAIAAYNAGEAAVDRWEKEIVTDDIEEFVERIPYLETRGYVKLVLRNHRIYKRLYESQK